MKKRKQVVKIKAYECPVCKNSTHVVVKQFTWNARVWCDECRRLDVPFSNSPEGYGSDEIDAITCWNRLVNGK